MGVVIVNFFGSDDPDGSLTTFAPDRNFLVWHEPAGLERVTMSYRSVLSDTI